MKHVIVYILLFVALAGNLFLWQQLTTLKATVAAERASKDFPLGESMGYMQRYAQKLWFAGNAQNWPLAKFYRDELAETANDIAKAHVTKEGVEISSTLQSLLPPVFNNIDEAISGKNPALFRNRYQSMVDTCNACHDTAKHSFIQIMVPSGEGAFWNQQFETPFR